MHRIQLIYDGSFEGFLSAVFLVFERKLTATNIVSIQQFEPQLFGVEEKVISETNKADRVWKGLKQKLPQRNIYQLYSAYLSEQKNIENRLLDYIKTLFNSEISIATDYSNPSVLKIAQVAKMVGREKHRMEAFVRFKLTKDGIYFSNISPDFNVLPLISKHFEKRYADQKWIIYDLHRKYGLYYDLNSVSEINLELSEDFDSSISDSNYFTNEELDFENLWKDYFKSVTITSRKNKALHERHVPKRYWKYLSEKQ